MMKVTRFFARYRGRFCCFALIWTLGIVLGSVLLTNWHKTRPMSVSDDRNYPNILELLRKRTILNKNNPKVVRAMKICSPLTENDGKTTEEGKGIEGSRLESVVVLMRHGARGPLVDFVNRTEVDCSVNRTENPDYKSYARYVKDAERRRSSRDRFRSFDSVVRTGKVCGLGQLSEYGALQQLRTGQLFRKAYGGKLIMNERDVTIVSTNTERTYQSAIAFLYGLVPDFDFAQIVPKIGRGSTLCYTQEFCDCSYVDKLAKYNAHFKSSLLENHKAVIQLLSEFEEVLYHGMHHDAVVQSDSVFDKLLVFVCHRDALPCIDETTCITVDQLNNVISFHEFRNKQMMIDKNLRVMSRLSMQGLLTEILRKMEDVRRKRNKRGDNFVFYSAHDITVLPMTLALGFYDGLQLPYSARIVFELYSRPSTSDFEDSTKIFHLKILFNGKDVTKRVSFCSRQLNEAVQYETFCLLDTFAQFVHDDYLKELNVTSFRKACQLQNLKFKKYNFL